MAEATTERQRNECIFYCHKCSTEISPKLPDFLCPICDGGFIEELTDDFTGNDTTAEGAQTTRNPFQLFQPIGPDGSEFMRSFSAQDDTDSEEEEFADAAASPQLSIPRARISVRTLGHGGDDGRQVFQGLLEQILRNLTGVGRGNVVFGMNQGPGQFGFFNMGGLAGNPGDYAWGPGGLDSIITQLMNQLEGAGPPPASAEKIETLPTVTVSASHVEKNLQCSVCFEDFNLEEKVRQLPCQHMYHTDCIKPWLQMHGTCPICRKTLEGEDTSCDENTQSIPQTLENFGLDASAMSPRRDASSQAQQADVNGSTSAPSRESNRDDARSRGTRSWSRDEQPECD